MISIYISKWSSSSVVPHVEGRFALHSLKHSVSPFALPLHFSACSSHIIAANLLKHLTCNIIFPSDLPTKRVTWMPPTCRGPFHPPPLSLSVHAHVCVCACRCVCVCWGCVALWAWSRLNKLHLSAKVLRIACHAPSLCPIVSVTSPANYSSPSLLAFIIITRRVKVKTAGQFAH